MCDLPLLPMGEGAVGSGQWGREKGGTTLTLCRLMLLLCRQALRYMIRNTTLPPRVRAEAQLQLSQMHCYTNPTQIRNRCILGGKGRGVLRDFKLSRVGFSSPHLVLFITLVYGKSIVVTAERCGARPPNITFS